jgi:hypothetical protein
MRLLWFINVYYPSIPASGANNPFGFNFKDFSLPGFPKGKKGSSIFDGLAFFSDKHPAKFGGLPGLPKNAQKQSSGSDMLGTMCGMMSGFPVQTKP